jgi:Sec-independent protein secretion pathway component TatC
MAQGQALIALGRARLVAIGWVLGVVGLLVVTALGDDLLLRVELGFLAGSGLAAGFMAWSLWRAVRQGAQLHLGEVIEALHDLPLEF